jgi:hypothetical protein
VTAVVPVGTAERRTPATVQGLGGEAARGGPRLLQPPTAVPHGQPLASETMRAVQITRFGGPEVLDVVDLPDPVPGPAQQLYEVSSAGVNFADTHHPLSQEPGRRPDRPDGE